MNSWRYIFYPSTSFSDGNIYQGMYAVRVGERRSLYWWHFHQMHHLISLSSSECSSRESTSSLMVTRHCYFCLLNPQYKLLVRESLFMLAAVTAKSSLIWLLHAEHIVLFLTNLFLLTTIWTFIISSHKKSTAS